MVEKLDLTPWLRACDESPRIRIRRICERAAVQQCRRGCMRAALSPCINASIHVVAGPTATIFAQPCLLKYIMKCRDKMLEENKHRSLKQLMALRVLTYNCYNTCVPQWKKLWGEYCLVLFKRICLRASTSICEANCRQSCRSPCLRTPLHRLRLRGRAHRRVGSCLIRCIESCLRACLRACKTTMPQWLDKEAKHICRPVLTETSRILAAKWLAEDIIRERKRMTEKCNVLNGCKF